MDLIERNAAIARIDCCLGNSLGGRKEFDSGLMQAREFVISTPAVNRWIPVDDSLPEIGYNVLVTRQTESNARYIRIASRQDDCWMDSTDEYGKPNPHLVIAWMPMPDAYEPPNSMIGD